MGRSAIMYEVYGIPGWTIEAVSEIIGESYNCIRKRLATGRSMDEIMADCGLKDAEEVKRKVLSKNMDYVSCKRLRELRQEILIMQRNEEEARYDRETGWSSMPWNENNEKNPEEEITVSDSEDKKASFDRDRLEALNTFVDDIYTNLDRVRGVLPKERVWAIEEDIDELVTDIDAIRMRYYGEFIDWDAIAKRIDQ